MNGVHWYAAGRLALLSLLPLLAGLYWYAAAQRRAALARFVDSGMRDHLLPRGGGRLGRAGLFFLALALLIVALARPAWNRRETTVRRSGRDVVFLLDVSRSMLAQDLAPSRLEHAKLAISDVIDRLRGDRVALVVFAGQAVVKCPLTLDYGFFRLALEGVSPDSVSRGGTKIGDALRTVLHDVLDNQAQRYQDVILITDGEDHGSYPLEAAKAAGERGVRLIVIGLGDEKEGARIPVIDDQGRQTFLKYQGQEVWSKLDGTVLRQMAEATPGGRYLPVATGNINLGEVYQELIMNAGKRQLAAKTVTRFQEKFQFFLLAALLLLLGEMTMREDWR